MFDIIRNLIKNGSTMNVRIVFIGTPEFAATVLGHLLRSPHKVLAVVTQPDKAAGRGHRVAVPPVKQLALEQQIPVLQLETFRSNEVVETLASFEPELIIVAAFSLILPPKVLSLPKFGCLNVHPSLLPRHRGPSPVAGAILHGDELTGATIMLMDAGLDTGPILAQEKVGVSFMDTTGSLSSRLADVGARLLLETMPRWLAGELKAQPQDESQATYSELISSKDAEIDWRLSAVELWRRVRAYNPCPSCHTWCQGKRIRIHRAIPLGDAKGARPGEVIILPEPPGVGAATGQGVLGLCELQQEGKRPMSADEFIRGKRDFIGCILGQGHKS
jgi:methionyl-tRNA formyltransferase